MTRPMAARIDRSGRITLPKAILDALGIVSGTEVEIEEFDGVIVIRRSASADDEPSSQRVREAIADGLASGSGRVATDDVVSELRRQAFDTAD